jgi:hypothetical protein
MDTRGAFFAGMNLGEYIVQAYLGDLSDAELLMRPTPGANHIAWQLGHLISSEQTLMEGIAPGTMPPLPAGFAEKHTKETTQVDDPRAFLTKAEYLKLKAEQRSAARAAIAKFTDADLDRPAPEKFRKMFPTVGVVVALIGMHDIMHAGQWAVLRRKLGKPIVI